MGDATEGGGTVTAMRRRWIVLVASSLLLCVVAACGGGSSGATGSGKVLDASFARLDGTTARFADYRGRPVVVNFFSSTCPPCVREMPSLEQLHRALGDSVAFVGMDVQDTVESGKAFTESVGVTWDLGRDPTADILQHNAGGVALPTTLVLDAQGRIVYSKLGVVDVDQLRQHLRALGVAT